MGTSRDELPTFRLPDRDPDCRKEDFQLGKVCILFPGLVVAGPHRLSGPRGEFLESAATVAPSRDEVLCEGRLGAPGLLGSAWLSLATPAEPHPTVQGVTPCGEVGPSVALAVKSWLCLRIRTVIRCWTREVPAKKTDRERPGCECRQTRQGALQLGPRVPGSACCPAPSCPSREDSTRACHQPRWRKGRPLHPQNPGTDRRIRPLPRTDRHGAWSTEEAPSIQLGGEEAGTMPLGLQGERGAGCD